MYSPNQDMLNNQRMEAEKLRMQYRPNNSSMSSRMGQGLTSFNQGLGRFTKSLPGRAFQVYNRYGRGYKKTLRTKRSEKRSKGKKGTKKNNRKSKSRR